MNSAPKPRRSKLLKTVRTFLRTHIPQAEGPQLARQLTWRILAMRPLVRLAIFAIALAATIFGLLGPYFQKHFVDELLTSKLAAGDSGKLAIWITLAFLALLASQGLTTLLRIVSVREATLVHRWLSTCLYKHMLRLDHTSRRSHTVGEIVSIYAQDISSAVALIDEFLPMVVTSIVPLVVAPIAIGLYFNVPLLPLGIVTFGSLLFLFTLSLRQSRFFAAFKRLAAERLAVVNEWLQNIRIIRILGWTEAFEAKILVKRELETENRLGMVTNGSSMNAYAQAAPGLIATTGIASIVLTHVEVTAGEIFGLLWVLSVFLSRSLRTVPWNIVIFLDGLSSCRRLEKIFALPTESRAALNLQSTSESPSPRPTPHGLALEVRGLNLTLGDAPLLEDVGFHLREGELVAIVGEVGAGKTLLLDSLLRETPASFGSYKIAEENALAWDFANLRSHFAYVPQDGFVMSSTLRDNIAFTYDTSLDFDATVTRSLQLAAFDPSETTLTAGLETEIGERGVNLSGGQRQRVNLGRAHFSGRPIILLDDCLSAVDVDTERRLLEELIEGAWRQRTRLLVTHRLSVLPRVDRILVMSKGRFVDEGSFDDLMQRSEYFRHITRSLNEAEAPAAQTSGAQNDAH